MQDTKAEMLQPNRCLPESNIFQVIELKLVL